MRTIKKALLLAGLTLGICGAVHSATIATPFNTQYQFYVYTGAAPADTALSPQPIDIYYSVSYTDPTSKQKMYFPSQQGSGAIVGTLSSTSNTASVAGSMFDVKLTNPPPQTLTWTIKAGNPNRGIIPCTVPSGSGINVPAANGYSPNGAAAPIAIHLSFQISGSGQFQVCIADLVDKTGI